VKADFLSGINRVLKKLWFWVEQRFSAAISALTSKGFSR
jgi:hypothetical protein